MNLKHQVVLVTGASRGLGLALARLAARQGARLIVTARGADDLAAAARALAAAAPEGGAVFALPGDVADPDHAARLVREGEARLGPVDVLINNASELGETPLPALERYPLAALERALRTNAVAPLHLIQLVLPGMRRRRTGAIVNITSDAAVEAYPGWGGYGASKAALEALSRVLAVETEGSGVRVYAVDPGDMDTRMHREAVPDADPLDLADPEAVAPAILGLVGLPHSTAAGRPDADGPPPVSGRYAARDLQRSPALTDAAEAAPRHPDRPVGEEVA
jgi:NAD(P)-dependent dehydrogenase (short-subunit alcohol dehydrogenase family)